MNMDIHTYIKDFRYGYDSTLKTKNVKFKYYDFEKKFINHINNNRFSIIKKSRQMHMTNLLSNYVAWDLLMNNNSENPPVILYFSNSSHMSHLFIEMVKDSINNFINILGMKGVTFEDMCRINTKSEIYLKNGNRIKGTYPYPDALKGFTATLIIADECAFIQGFDAVMGYALPMLGVGGKMILVSTPNGLDGGFYKSIDLSMKGKNEFEFLSLNYQDNPQFTDEWYKDMCRINNNNQINIKQELLGQFIFTKDGLKGMDLTDRVFYEPIEVDSFNKNFKLTKRTWYSMDIVKGAPQSGEIFEQYKELINSLECE